MNQDTEPSQLKVSFRGLKFEDPHQSRWTYELSKPTFNFFMTLGSATVTNGLPESGPGLVLMNHISGNDVFMAHGLPIATAGRTLRLVARKSLIDLQTQDSEKAIERRAQHDNRNKNYADLSPYGKFKRKMEAFYMSQFDTIMVDIGGGREETQRFFGEVMGELMNDHLVGMFFQGTRRPRLDLLDDLEGAAILLARYFPKAANQGKNIPVYPVGLSGTNGHPFRHIEVNIGHPFYYTDVPKVEEVSRIESARQLIRDRVGELVADPKMKAAWELSKRGLSREAIEEAYQNNPSLVSVLDSIDNPTQVQIA